MSTCLWFVGWGPALVISFHYRHKLLLWKLLLGNAWIYCIVSLLLTEQILSELNASCREQVPGWSEVYRLCRHRSHLKPDKDSSGKPRARRQFPSEMMCQTAWMPVWNEQWFQMALSCHHPHSQILSILITRTTALPEWPWCSYQCPVPNYVSQCCPHWLLPQKLCGFSLCACRLGKCMCRCHHVSHHRRYGQALQIKWVFGF